MNQQAKVVKSVPLNSTDDDRAEFDEMFWGQVDEGRLPDDSDGSEDEASEGTSEGSTMAAGVREESPSERIQRLTDELKARIHG